MRVKALSAYEEVTLRRGKDLSFMPVRRASLTVRKDAGRYFSSICRPVTGGGKICNNTHDFAHQLHLFLSNH